MVRVFKSSKKEMKRLSINGCLTISGVLESEAGQKTFSTGQIWRKSDAEGARSALGMAVKGAVRVAAPVN